MKKILKFLLILLIVASISICVLYFTGVVDLTKLPKKIDLDNIVIPTETDYIDDKDIPNNTSSYEGEMKLYEFLQKFDNGDICWYYEKSDIALEKESQYILFEKECYIPELGGILGMSEKQVCAGIDYYGKIYYSGTYTTVYGQNVGNRDYYGCEIKNETFDVNLFDGKIYDKNVTGVEPLDIGIEYELSTSKKSVTKDSVEDAENTVHWTSSYNISIEYLKEKALYSYSNGVHSLKVGDDYIVITTDGSSYIDIKKGNRETHYILNNKEKCQYVMDAFERFNFNKAPSNFVELDRTKYNTKLQNAIKAKIPTNQTYEVKEDDYELSSDIFLSQELAEDRCCATTQVIGVINSENSIKFSYSVKIFFDTEKIISDGLINVSENSITYSITDEYISHVEINRKELTDAYNIKINKLFVDIILNDDGTYQRIYELDYVFETNNLEFSFKGVDKGTGTYTKTLNNGQVKYSETPLTREKNITISNFKFKDDFNNLYSMPDINDKTNEISFSQDYYYFKTVKYIENINK